MVEIGHLRSKLANTFWQLLDHSVRQEQNPAGRSFTPPGFADNGGLVATSAKGTSLVTGFQANQLNHFSPVAASSDGGKTWAPGVLGQGIADVPDAMAASITGKVLALVGRPASSVLWSVGNLSDWQTLASEKWIASSPISAGCAVTTLPLFPSFLEVNRSSERPVRTPGMSGSSSTPTGLGDPSPLSLLTSIRQRDDAGAAPSRLRAGSSPRSSPPARARIHCCTRRGSSRASLTGRSRARSMSEVRTGALLRDIIWRWCLRRPFERDVRKRRSGGDFQRFVDTTSGCTERYRDGRIFRERPCRRTRVERLGADRLHTGRQPTPMATVAGGQGADPVRLVELSTDRKSSSPVDLSTTILAHENQFHAGGIGPLRELPVAPSLVHGDICGALFASG